MHIAIDDTYGGAGGSSKYVTDKRRTHVAVVFPDNEVDYIREELKECITEVRSLTKIEFEEFHFVDIYNRTGPWKVLKANNSDINLKIIQAFAEIYFSHKWPVYLQTIDVRTLSDHGFEKIDLSIDGLDLKKFEDLSLFFLLMKVKKQYKNTNEPLVLYLDEGRGKPGKAFGNQLFSDWPSNYHGIYQSSKAEPLLQLADFIAFCINRATHIGLKANRTEFDIYFLELVTSMQINCSDLTYAVLPRDFSTQDFDDVHRKDRIEKGIEDSIEGNS